jgi:hypothetical protein
MAAILDQAWLQGKFEKSEPKIQPRTQALSSTLLAGENTLAGAGHVYPKFWVAKSIIAVGGVGEEHVCY